MTHEDFPLLPGGGGGNGVRGGGDDRWEGCLSVGSATDIEAWCVCACASVRVCGVYVRK